MRRVFACVLQASRRSARRPEVPLPNCSPPRKYFAALTAKAAARPPTASEIGAPRCTCKWEWPTEGHVQVGVADGALSCLWRSAARGTSSSRARSGKQSNDGENSTRFAAARLRPFGWVALLVAVTGCRQPAWVARSVAWCSRKVEYSGA